MTNAQKFLDFYNDLDKVFAKELNHTDYVAFSSKVRELFNKNSVVRRYVDDLYQLGSLRNAISHQSKGGAAIAEPHFETVELIEKILQEFKNPLKVIPKFLFEVYAVTTESDLIELLDKMKTFDFSQAPVLDESGSVIEMISTNTISRWLFGQMKHEEIILPGVKVAELISFIETPKNYALISRNTTVFEAAEIYVKASKDKKSKLDCLIITHSGKSTEKLMGIVCIEDIAEYLMD
ncbi:HPP family protein [Cognataquiflexum rubidum]|uniref:CBS domain-containing protein n=1 Tax=Cognataquiflexum rubidum TaxID=2922273 RepID=UPI001F140AC1|nr:CBS domain-containing protein [Cognataquiflexum rubidum]MCH6236667.1 CBS domain-containing protein [Cognataquiflexum rubidum]